MASQAAEAMKAEVTDSAEGAVMEVEFRGHTYQLPANVEEWDLEVQEAIEDERMVGCLRALLGETQWSLLKRRHKPKMKELDEIANVFLNAVGLSLGKSES